MLRPDNDNAYVPIGKLKANLAMTMGGRAAEELIIKDYTTGASADIRQASSTARKMVTEWGMSKLGPIYYGTDHEVFLGRDYGASHAYSEDMAAKIDAEVNRLVEEAHKKAYEIISANLDKLDVMVRVLIECETIYAEEVAMIMNGASIQDVKDALENRYKTKSRSTGSGSNASTPVTSEKADVKQPETENKSTDVQGAPAQDVEVNKETKNDSDESAGEKHE